MCSILLPSLIHDFPIIAHCVYAVCGVLLMNMDDFTVYIFVECELFGFVFQWKV